VLDNTQTRGALFIGARENVYEVGAGDTSVWVMFVYCVPLGGQPR
jgi:hypothetical protein